MTCENQLTAYQGARGGALVFNKPMDGRAWTRIELPCGQCILCRLEHARQWAVRITHEAQRHKESSFITLTYDDKHVPEHNSLDYKRDMQPFWKRLRKEYGKISYYAVGEYGEKNLRPHYHIILFNHDFPDKTLFSNKNKQKLFTSPTLSNLWPHGFSTTGAVTFQSAAYCARYTLKKIGGKLAADHYYRLSPTDGNFYSVRPEFAVMSRGSGIGSAWLERYKGDVYPSGFIVADGKPQGVPRFYKLKLTEEEQEHLKRQGRARALRFEGENTNWRRHQRATVRDARISNLKRTLGD